MAELQTLIKKRGIIKATLTNIKKFADKFILDTNQAVNTEQIETRIEKLNEAWKEFHDVEYQILLLDDGTSEADDFEDRFYEIKACLKRLLKIRTPSIGVATSNPSDNRSMFENHCDRSFYQSSELRLPRVIIEHFSGDYAKWQSFQDQFESSIHSKDNLSNIHKFQYLKSLLKNEAASLIRHMALTDANYILAWEKVKKRYNKKKYTVRELIELFLNQPSVNAEGYKQLRTICDTSDEVLRGLQALGTEWQTRDPWLIHIITKKIDVETQQAWAKHSIDTDVPTINDLLDFLTERCDALETCTSIKRPNYNRQHTKVHTTTAVVISCALCNATNHPLFRCFRFKKLKLAERQQIIETNSMCQNCLNSSHDISNCQSRSRCFTCGDKHHTLLHQDSISSSNSKHKANALSNETKSSSSYLSTLDSAINKELYPPTINKKNNPSTFNKESKTSTSINISPVINKTSVNSSTRFQTASTSGECESTHDITKLPKSLTHCCSTDTSDSRNTAPAHGVCPVNTLLSTAFFTIIDEFGNSHRARGLLDSGSQTTLISEGCVNRVGLSRNKSNVIVNGLASQTAGITKGEVNLHIVSNVEPECSIFVKALILNTLTSRLPTNKFDDSHLPIIKNLKLADPTYNCPGIIDIILGNDIFYEILRSEKLQIADHLFAQATIFGWVLGGQLSNSTSAQESRVFHTTTSNNEDVMQLISRFWDIEEVSGSTTHNQSDDECEDHYKQNTTKADCGKYIVKLPFKLPRENLGSTYQQAMRRFFMLEKKFSNNQTMKEEYLEFIKEYISLGHMEKIEAEDSTSYQLQQSYHLPHHCVIKDSSSTTKLRVVFDGSCKSTTGYSLNDVLLVGPTIQDDLTTILLRFRLHKIAISADIEKMYRQVLLHPVDRDLQRIIWRNSPSDKLQQYRLTTVTYGTSSAPFLACRTLHQLADDHKELYPDATTRLKSDFYVDDMLTGCYDLKEAIQTYEDMSSLLQKGGFNLRKWMTNDPLLANHIPEAERETKFLEFEGASLVKTLGLLWNPQTDCFNFRVTLKDKPKLTKRTLLSEASQIFDPLGWLSPSIILIKMLFQQLWLRKLNWDDELPHDVKEDWVKLRSSLHHLQNIQIPRFVFTHRPQNIATQLHGFSDASELAYGAAVYIRVLDSAGNILVNLLAAKTKVCPIKQISLPRLELCAAVLLCKLVKYIKQTLKLEFDSTHAWTDSQIALAWLSDLPKRWKCFIGNRTSYILEIIPRDQWMYVPSKQNPADSASRGLTPQLLITNKLWWNGPEWLKLGNQYWPKTTTTWNKTNQQNDELEIRTKYVNTYHTRIAFSHPCHILFNRCSSLTKIYRILSYIVRFINRARRLHEQELSSLKDFILPPTVDELTKSEILCIKWVQAQSFSEDLQHIIHHGEVIKGSILSSLTPFIDNHGIMRVGGRISNSSCNFDTKHPIIVPQNHTFSKLLIDKYHRDNFHPGPTLLTSIIRQKYWLIGCRKATRYHFQKCILCFMKRRVLNQQLMADLPKERVTQGRPFLNVGIDYAGPLYIKDRRSRGKQHTTKAYIALFICLSIKAIHIEIVSDMTTEAFIAALRRFISRRGIPCQIHCDNGSNFVGARNELHALYDLFKSDNHTKLIFDFLSPQKIRFKFNPAGAPHFGGLWESNIKSIKSHLFRVSGNTTLTYEEANTLLIQIEGVLNSRPLCAVSDDVTSYDVLTPAHFLIGEPFTSIPEPELTHIPTSRLSKWQNIQNRIQSFWRSWSRDYLSTLNQRFKWRTKAQNLNINQIVLIRDDNIPKSYWIIGRILQVHASKDGLVRVATVKTAKGEFKRPIVKLIPLPIEDNDNLTVTDDTTQNSPIIK